MRIVFIVLLIAACCPWSAAAGDIPPLDGLVEPWETVSFSSHVPGILEKVNVERGAWVKRGTVLAQIKSGVERANVQLAKARVDFGKRKLERNEQLFNKKLMSVHQRDELETEVKLAEMELQEANEKLKLLSIHSTIDGVVVERIGSPGEYVGEKPFLTVAQINPLRVEVIVPTDLYGKIKVDDVATVQLGEPIDKELPARVVIVDQVMDAASGTFGVRLKLPNDSLTLPAGLKCKVIFKNL